VHFQWESVRLDLRRATKRKSSPAAASHCI
jgi:hypothetical protein